MIAVLWDELAPREDVKINERVDSALPGIGDEPVHLGKGICAPSAVHV